MPPYRRREIWNPFVVDVFDFEDTGEKFDMRDVVVRG
jgi:hypothetical protein